MTGPLRERTVTLTGWGRYPAVKSRVYRPERVSELVATLRGPYRAVLARGAGRSYGDAALNPLGATLCMERLDRILAFDKQTGVVRCEAGVPIRDLLDTFLPRGWFPAVTPGTKLVTVGGAVAGDVHGKNHHRAGSFCTSVRSLVVLTSAAEVVSCSPADNRELFLATVGGMGLTGVILEVELALREVPSAYVVARTVRAKDLEEVIALFDRYESEFEYSVAWVNGTAEGRRLGEGIVYFGNHAAVAELPGTARQHPLKIRDRHRLGVPVEFPSWILNRHSTSLFNRLYFSQHHHQETQSLIDYDAFFYPLDALANWNRLYGKRGFIQYQSVVPINGGPATLRSILEHCQRQGLASSLGVLKRFGPGGSWLSFPMPGYTLSLDTPVIPGVWTVLDELDRLVVSAGGRVNLAKDARLNGATFRAMYPEYPDWLAVKNAVDPDNRFSSGLAQRLSLGSA